MSQSRRAFLKGASVAAALTPGLALAADDETQSEVAEPGPIAPGYTPDFGETAEEAEAIAYAAHQSLMEYPGLHMHGSEVIAMLVYPGMTMLDLVGPQYFFASLMGARLKLVTADQSLAPVLGDTGFAIVPDTHFDDCPQDVDLLFVPGGIMGTIDAMKDDATIEFISDRGSRAKYVTSVCTGSLILGQAGLLRGKKATCHWAAHHLLSEFGATPTQARVVRDGNLVTGAGVSAGIDLAIEIATILRGEPYAKVLQLTAQYAPEPRFSAGDPKTIEPRLGKAAHEMFASSIYKMKDAAKPHSL